MIERFIGVIAPHSCLACSREGAVLCEWCLPEAFTTIPDRCFICAALSHEAQTCTKCYSPSRPKHVWVATTYEGVSKQAIHALKFSRKRSAHKLIAEIIDDRLPVLDKNTIIAHIPTATSRRRQRGYDQSELIARCLAKRRGLLHASLLARQGQARQVGANRTERIKQMQNAFWVRKLPQHPAKILLVDDLLTTGATIEAATKTLKKADYKHIYATVFAQRST